ncbi:MAG: PAS domain S-box protein [Cyanobacteria bacterium P01_G01_bin.19]
MGERLQFSTSRSAAENESFIVKINALTKELDILSELFELFPTDDRAAYLVIQNSTSDCQDSVEQLLDDRTKTTLAQQSNRIAELESDRQAQQQKIIRLERELLDIRKKLPKIVEELKSRNQAQQVSNEELIASNEELHSITLEYSSKIQQLTELNNDIDNLLQSTEIGVIFLDRQLRIRKYTTAASEIVALRQTDIERPLAELSWKIDCPNLLDLLQQVLDTKQSHSIEVKLKQTDSYFLMRTYLYRAEKRQDEGLVVTFVKIDDIKQAQQALKERERSFQATFNSMFQFMWVLSPIGILLEANQTALTFADLTLSDVLDRPFWLTPWWQITSDNQKELKQAISRAALGEFIRYEVDIIGAEGRIATIDFSLKPVIDEAGQVVQLIPEGREISELKQAREKLEQTNLDLEDRVNRRTQTLALFGDRLKQIHRLAIAEHNGIRDMFDDYLQTGCQMLDLNTGIISKVNNQDRSCKIVAVESSLDLIIGTEVPIQNTYCAQTIKTKSTVAYDWVGKTKSMEHNSAYLRLKLESFIGTPISVNGELYGTLSFLDSKPRKLKFTEEERELIELMARDIGNSIASLQTKKALEKSESNFRNTFEQAAVGVAHVSPQGDFIRVNQRFADILNYDRQTLIDLSFSEITHPEDLSTDLTHIQRILSGEIANYSLEKRYLKSDRSSVWVNLTVSLVKDDLGEPDYFILVIEDISDRKSAENALKESRVKLKQANQAKDNFIAHMSHELRTPLTSILGFSKLLQKDSLLPSQRLRYANLVHQSGEHLLTLIDDILDFSKITASQLKLESEDFSLIPFLTQIVTILKVRAQEKGIKLSTIFSPTLPTTVNGDFNRLRQVLYNLIGNAIKFTDAGSVTLKVSCVADSSRSAEDNGRRAEKIRFEVEDTGIGIPKSKLTDIFAPFEQLHSNTAQYKGTGLGLTISQNIIGLMNSQIYLESQEDRGSKFWFDLELPIVEDLPIVCAYQYWQQPRRLQTAQKILIVDDNEENRMLLVGFLQPLGFIIEEANNGAIALAIAKTFQPDAILTDSIMPVMNGREMIVRIKQESPLKDIPIFIISANSHTNMSSAGVDCDGFLSKPIDLEQLLELLETHLELDWRLEERKAGEDIGDCFDVPPQNEIANLLELVSFGDLQALEIEVEALVKLEAKYTSFAREVQQLARGCQQNQLEYFLSKFLDNA